MTSKDGSVVQHEGWLFKYGAGYTLGGQAKVSTLDRFRGRLEKRRFFSLVTTSAEAATNKAYYSKTNANPHAHAHAHAGDGVHGKGVFKGKGKNKAHMQGVLQTKPPKAELRYYAQQPTDTGNSNGHSNGNYGQPRDKPRGVILLTADMKVDLIEGSLIRLRGHNRTYFMRPDVPEEQRNTAHARTSAAQWEAAIDFAIRGLQAWEMSNAEGGLHPMQDPKAIRGGQRSGKVDGSEMSDLRDKEKEGGGGNGGQSQSHSTADIKAQRKHARRSKNVGNQGGAALDGEFTKMWGSHGLLAYNELVAHFGPVQLDIQRLAQHYSSRMKQMQADIQVLQESAQKSKEFAVTEQRTTRHAVRDFNRSTEAQRVVLEQFPKRFEESVIDPLNSLSNEIKVKLDNVVNYNTKPVAEIERARRLVEAAAERIAQLQQAVAEAERGGNQDHQLEKGAQGNNSHSDGNKRRTSNMLRRTSTPDRVTLERNLNEARKTRRDCEASLMHVEAKHTSQLISAMYTMEKLESHRLSKMREIMLVATQLESELNSKLKSASSGAIFKGVVEGATEVAETIQGIDAKKDMKATFKKLKRIGEENRPAGRHRKQNSLVRRSEFLSAFDQDEIMDDVEEEEEEETVEAALQREQQLFARLSSTALF